MNEYLTQAKKADLEVELKNRKLVIRPEILERVLAAHDLGDLPENAEYESSRNEQSKNEDRIIEIEAILKHAKIIERSGSDKAELGATVTVKNLSSNTEKSFILVGAAESDIDKNKISTSSPMGMAIIGKTAGERFTITTLRGDVEYEIIIVS